MADTAAVPRKRKEKDKQHRARVPFERARYKEMFLARLRLGRSPAVAAGDVDLCRSTVFRWKQEDAAFDAAWQDAVEASLDLIETKLYERAVRDNSGDAHFILTHRRREVYGKRDGDRNSNNVIVSITLAEHAKRLERLGLPVPQIEGDYYDDEALATSADDAAAD
jgi:hypothetical protein